MAGKPAFNVALCGCEFVAVAHDGVVTAVSASLQKSLPCVRGGGFCEAKDGRVGKTIPHPTPSGAPFTQGSLSLRTRTFNPSLPQWGKVAAACRLTDEVFLVQTNSSSTICFANSPPSPAGEGLGLPMLRKWRASPLSKSVFVSANLFPYLTIALSIK